MLVMVVAARSDISSLSSAECETMHRVVAGTFPQGLVVRRTGRVGHVDCGRRRSCLQSDLSGTSKDGRSLGNVLQASHRVGVVSRSRRLFVGWSVGVSATAVVAAMRQSRP
jgi:hypothetical protein